MPPRFVAIALPLLFCRNLFGGGLYAKMVRWQAVRVLLSDGRDVNPRSRPGKKILLLEKAGKSASGPGVWHLQQ